MVIMNGRSELRQGAGVIGSFIDGQNGLDAWLLVGCTGFLGMIKDACGGAVL